MSQGTVTNPQAVFHFQHDLRKASTAARFPATSPTEQSGEFPAAGVVPVSWSDHPRRISGNTKGRARRPAGGSACDTWRSDTASPSEPFSAGPASPFWARSWASTSSPAIPLESADPQQSNLRSPRISGGSIPRDRTFTAHSTPRRQDPAGPRLPSLSAGPLGIEPSRPIQPPVGRTPRDRAFHPSQRGSPPLLKVTSFSLPLWSRTAAEIERCFGFQVERFS